MTKTIGFTDIDFDRNGKQVGFLNLPSSVHDDAWGVIRVPLTVIKNGQGPTVILQGGNHGDEYEGPIVLGEIIRDLDPAKVSGRLIIVPAINLPAVVAARRVSPVDGLNFNRTFPGDPLGSPTQQLSSYVNDVLFPLADAFVDLHSGGSSLSIIPSAIIEPAEDAELARKNRAAVAAFGAPMTVVIANLGDPRTSTSSACRAGLITVGTEMAGRGTVSPEAVKVCRRGVHNVLHHLGVVESADPASVPTDLSPAYEIAGHRAYVLATDAGVFEPYHELGTEVKAGQPAGRIHFLNNPARAPEVVHYGLDGVVYALRHPGHVISGSCCAVIVSACKDFAA
ncbi:succinylglutamate desuccinylase/aspartoacylase family protein [Rhizobium setariae]|uniref:succinylglutamate desuccinylase/aspartoacylase family protein n=1 Tax=Rhizobium setariae TaxID=2801340 RepID=UPI0031BBB192